MLWKRSRQAKDAKPAKSTKQAKQARQAKQANQAKPAKQVKRDKQAKQAEQAQQLKQAKQVKQPMHVAQAKQISMANDFRETLKRTRRQDVSRKSLSGYFDLPAIPPLLEGAAIRLQVPGLVAPKSRSISFYAFAVALALTFELAVLATEFVDLPLHFSN